MNYKELKAIRSEVLRFDKTLQEALKEAVLVEDIAVEGGKPTTKVYQALTYQVQLSESILT